MSAEQLGEAQRYGRRERACNYAEQYGCTKLAHRVIDEWLTGRQRVELDSDSPDHVDALQRILNGQPA